jgi:hypothetical protein
VQREMKGAVWIVPINDVAALRRAVITLTLLGTHRVATE